MEGRRRQGRVRVRTLEELRKHLLQAEGGDAHAGIEIDIPLDVGVPEYRAIAEFADARGYAIADERGKLEAMVRRREREMEEIGRTIGELQRMVDDLDGKLARTRRP